MTKINIKRLPSEILLQQSKYIMYKIYENNCKCLASLSYSDIREEIHQALLQSTFLYCHFTVVIVGCMCKNLKARLFFASFSTDSEFVSNSENHVWLILRSWFLRLTWRCHKRTKLHSKYTMGKKSYFDWSEKCCLTRYNVFKVLALLSIILYIDIVYGFSVYCDLYHVYW